MSEQWRDCLPGYQVSNLGRVRRSEPGRKTFAGRVLKAQMMSIGYWSVRPVIDGKNKVFYVHALVAKAFLGVRPDGYSVNHIDGDKANNVPSNLEYVTHAGNMSHAAAAGLMAHGEGHPAAKLNDESVRALRSDRIGGMPFSRLAKKYGISIATAFNVARGTYWKHIA